MAQRLAMGIKLKITLAFSIVFVALNLLLNLIGYHEVRTMLMGNASTGQNLQRLRSMLVGYSLAGAAISALVSYMLARLLLRPLQRVIQAARNMTTNKMRDPIPVNGTRDEVYELTVSINEMMSRIDEALQQQQNFFGSASHELKTPLAILRTELEVGLRRQGLEESVRQLLSNQLEEISRLQAIVNEFLVVSQLRAGALSIYQKPFDLSVLIVKIFNQLLPLLKQKNLEPVIHFDEEMDNFIVQADEEKIRIVLLNLLENAAKYATSESAIVCTVERNAESEDLIVQFANTTREERVLTDYLQVAFYRSDLVQKGAGLGLWLCNEIMRLHDGKIDVVSGNYRFEVTIRLPIAQAIVARQT